MNSRRDGSSKGDVRAQAAARRVRVKAFLLKYLLAHPCVDCAESDPVVLEFDHVRDHKLFDISQSVKYRLESITAEIAKCEVRCANCHRRKTHREKDYLRRYDRSGYKPLVVEPQAVLFSR